MSEPQPVRLTRHHPDDPTRIRLQPAFAGCSVIPSDIEDARQIIARRDEILRDAQSQAEQLVLESRHTAEEAVRTARESASNDVRRAARSLLESLSALVETQRATYREELEQLALRLARVVVDAEFASNRGLIAQLIDQVVEDARRFEPTGIVLHPSDAEAIADAGVTLPEGMSLQLDETLPPGSVRLMTPSGSFVNSIDSRFSDLRRVLFGGED